MNSTKFGRYHVAEPYASLSWLHHATVGGPTYKTVDWEPPIAVLDQEDLFSQGIDTSLLVPGAQKVDALGSCTANAGTAAVSRILSASAFASYTGASNYQDTVGLEEHAILFYHECTDQTGDTSEEWPPVDCGSSGMFVVDLLVRQEIVSGAKIAVGAENMVSLMQTGGLLVGSPWFNSWMEPDANGFIDGNGTMNALEAAIASGVAGGHETYMSAIENLAFTGTGDVDPFKTVVRSRNSWTRTWGDNGSFRSHLSTWVGLSTHSDFRQLQPVQSA